MDEIMLRHGRMLLQLVVILAAGIAAGSCASRTSRTMVDGSPQYDPRRDSVFDTRARMAGLVMLLDRSGRPTGRLPSALMPVVQQFLDGNGKDVWGEPLRYHPAGLRYELRSAGPDRVFETADDIVFTGQLGRNHPCEIRDGYGGFVYEGLPRCSPDTPVVVLPLCPALVDEPYAANVRGLHDPVISTGLMLVRIARGIDGLGREVSGLPTDLTSVAGPDRLVDRWGRRVRYRPDGDSFEVRSAGRNGTFDDADDLVVQARLARTIPCEFQGPRGTATCTDPPPPCPEAST